jgi:hypothetical protein
MIYHKKYLFQLSTIPFGPPSTAYQHIVDDVIQFSEFAHLHLAI